MIWEQDKFLLDAWVKVNMSLDHYNYLDLTIKYPYNIG